MSGTLVAARTGAAAVGRPARPASLALHEKVGFRVVGRRERLGRHHGRWRDVLVLERRSPRIG